MQSAHEPFRFHFDAAEGAVLAFALTVAMAAAVRASAPPALPAPAETSAAIGITSSPSPRSIADDVAGMIADMKLHD